jgi:hypothetical protein
MSLVDQHVQFQNLAPLLRSESIEGFMRGTIFILMALKVHDTFKHDMDCFIGDYACFFHDRWSWGHLSLSFCIQFFRYYVNIVFQPALTSTIEKMIVLASDPYSRPPITIRPHDLHVGNIRGVVGEITSYHMKD